MILAIFQAFAGLWCVRACVCLCVGVAGGAGSVGVGVGLLFCCVCYSLQPPSGAAMARHACLDLCLLCFATPRGAAMARRACPDFSSSFVFI